MSILRKIAEEIVPLSRKQNLVLLIIIACVFQFVLFFTPALADEAVIQSKSQSGDQEIIVNDSLTKDGVMGNDAVELTKPLTLGEQETATSTGSNLTETDKTASSSQKTTATTTPAKVLHSSSHVITAYNSEAAQTDASPCTTANGFNVCKHGQEDTIAANFLKFGTKVKIPELFGDRVFIVRDRMNVKHPNRIDVWMKNKHDALKFGVKVAKIQVVE